MNFLIKYESLHPKVTLRDDENSQNMNVKYGIPILFIFSGFFVILINVLGTRTDLKRPKPHYGIDYKKDYNTLLDLENFTYEITPKCNATKLIWIVTSYAGDNSKRSALRRAYNSQELENLGIQRVFLLGKLDDITQKKTGISQLAIKNESSRFKDIVQGNFHEAYRNLTYKHIMGLKWIVENCNQALYVIKMDDDIIVNLYDILDKIKNININNSLVGYVLDNMTPKREPANKWFVTRNEFNSDFYPQFVSGWLYITNYSVVVKLIQKVNSHKYFWIDDVFVTGILREESNIKLINIREIYTTDYGFLKCCIEGGKNGFKCEFAIGPNGGDTELQIQFQKFAQFCQSKCNYKSIEKTCIVTYKENFGEGSAQIRPMKLI